MFTNITVPDVPLYRAIFPSSFYSIEAKPDKKSPSITYKLDNPKLRDMRHIQLDAYRRRWALAVDVDKPPEEWLTHLNSFRVLHPELTPSWVFHSLTTGHAHMVWTIDPVTTGPRARTAPQNFAQDIQATLTHIFDGDTGYKAHMTYNPVFTDYLLMDYSRGDHLRLQDNLRAGEDEGVIHVFDPEYLTPRTLKQLYEALKTADLWEDSSEARRKAPKKNGKRVSIPRQEIIRQGERNVSIFEEARLDPRDPYIVAHEINNSGRVQPPLRHSEVDGIARSIQGYRAKKGHKKTSGGLILSDQQRATLSQWGHKGGSRNTEAQKKARDNARKLATPAASIVRSAEAVGRRAQIRELKANGYTHKKICELLGIERTTVYRALKD